MKNFCIVCSKELTGRQTKYCSTEHREEHYGTSEAHRQSRRASEARYKKERYELDPEYRERVIEGAKERVANKRNAEKKLRDLEPLMLILALHQQNSGKL